MKPSHSPETTFTRFWSVYPKRVKKQDALKAWIALDPDDALIAVILEALRWQCQQEQWTKDPHFSFVPHAPTWIRGRRWEDEKPKTAAPQLTRFASLGMHRENR